MYNFYWYCSLFGKEELVSGFFSELTNYFITNNQHIMSALLTTAVISHTHNYMLLTILLFKVENKNLVQRSEYTEHSYSMLTKINTSSEIVSSLFHGKVFCCMTDKRCWFIQLIQELNLYIL